MNFAMTDMPFVHASNAFKALYIEGNVDEEFMLLYESTGQRHLEILMLLVMHRSRLVKVNSPACEFCFKYIYEAIEKEEALTKADVKRCMGWLYTCPDRLQLQGIERKLEMYIGMLASHFDQQPSESLQSTLSSISAIKQEPYCKPRTPIERQAPKEPLEDSCFAPDQSSILRVEALVEAPPVKKEQPMKVQHSPQSFRSEIEAYVSSLANAKIELNNFIQQLKLGLPVFDKVRDGNNWRSTCKLQTKNGLFDQYRRNVYEASDVQVNTKMAELAAASKVLIDIYSENPKIYQKFRQIKKRLKLQ